MRMELEERRKLSPGAFLTLQETVDLSCRVEKGIQSSFEEVKFCL